MKSRKDVERSLISNIVQLKTKLGKNVNTSRYTHRIEAYLYVLDHFKKGDTLADHQKEIGKTWLFKKPVIESYFGVMWRCGNEYIKQNIQRIKNDFKGEDLLGEIENIEKGNYTENLG
ncbi:MAG: hypothetical protein SLAVMIC_00951 [uncultured marine phage]|uniref:Uncharacterized protein n=1 Tax=uncultured marine phage TaxID=707152 RepID=A0A8D9CG14_9VIRU|nr:MAG: hypothetical protein SLAVMIC_00951 [uncultured marine phage]